MAREIVHIPLHLTEAVQAEGKERWCSGLLGEDRNYHALGDFFSVSVASGEEA